jgi:hypothetical protein
LLIDVQTRRPLVVVETKNHQEYYKSSQIEKYQALVGEHGTVIVAVPESGAVIFNSLYKTKGIVVDPILPPK